MGLEPVSPVLELTLQFMVIRELSVVDHGNVRKGVCPEGVGVTYIHPAFSCHSHVAYSMGTPELAYLVFVVHSNRRPHILDYLGDLANTVDLHSLDVHEGFGKRGISPS